jgi:hypothetical protein
MRVFTSIDWHLRSDVRVRLDDFFKIKHRDNAIVPSFSVRFFFTLLYFTFLFFSFLHPCLHSTLPAGALGVDVQRCGAAVMF